ncbi:hypothetical protein DO97_07365 [Neosynechococcus sphagnicola sy1]|uniref:TPM domain-containing protein n=2 Tax=Neosynechococcus TaxID=1501143 RepID=A0A098TP52_9CYAN|nr:hypothetical protein DO97_07365 [Neosynechococcus sphagnicola sy1]
MKPHCSRQPSWKTWLQSCLRSMVLLAFAAQMFLMTPAHATSVSEIGPLPADDANWVVDQGEVLSRITEGSLSQELRDLAQRTGYQVRVVTIHRLDYGETPASFARQLLTQWFPTADAQGKQAVLVLDTVTNGAALQTGTAVQSILPAAIAQSIVSENLAVPLRQSRYNQGLQDASHRLVAILSGQPDPGPPQVQEIVQVEGTFAKAEDTKSHAISATIWVVGLLIAATVIPMATYYFYLFLQSR